MYDWTEYAQTNARPRPLSDKKDFGICPLKPELEPWEVHTLGLHHPVVSTALFGKGLKSIVLICQRRKQLQP